MNVAVMVITDGRGDCLHKTMESFRKAWPEGVVPSSKLMVCDSPNVGFRRELAEAYPDFTLLTASKKLGFHGAIQRGWDSIGEADYVFHLEDDFDLTDATPLPIEEMAEVLSVGGFAQVALKRQAWAEAEKQAGGIVEQWPEMYEDRVVAGHVVAVHKNFFTTNPSLYGRDIVGLGWPQQPRSEAIFTERLLGKGYEFAYWGEKLDPPRVQHIGQQRVGTGY